MSATWVCITLSLSLLVHPSHQMHCENVSEFDTWYSSNSSGSVNVSSNTTECYERVHNTLGSNSLETGVSEHISLSVKRQGQKCLFFLNISDIENGIARSYVDYQPVNGMYGHIWNSDPASVSREHMETNTICQNVILTNSANSSITDLIISSPCQLSQHAKNAEGLPLWLGTYVLTFTLVLLDGSTSTGKYAFIHPHYLDLDSVDDPDFKPFYYLDISNDDVLHVRIHPVPEVYNVTGYQIALCRSGENDPIDIVHLNKTQKLEYIWTQFDQTGNYCVDVTLANRKPVCSEKDGVIIYFRVDRSGMHVLKMIISLSWIPFAVIFGLYYIGKYWRNSGGNRQKVLLISSATRNSHIEVMKSLTNYLRACKIDAFIGELDVSKRKDDLERPQPDVGQWLDETMKKVDVIIWATSPEFDPDHPPTPIFGNIDKLATLLLTEHYFSRGKKLWVVSFPSHKLESIPLLFPKSTVFHIPRDLDRLVKTIYGIRLGKFPRASKTDLLMKIEATKNPASIVPMKLQNMPNKTIDMKSTLIMPPEDFVPLIPSSSYFPDVVNSSEIRRQSIDSVNWLPCPESEE